MAESKLEFTNYLSEARRKTGRSLEDLAHASGVATQYIEALEQGRVELLPEGMHRRAIVRRYASVLGLEPRVTVERFERIFGPSLPPLIIGGPPAGKFGSTLWHRTVAVPVGAVVRLISAIVRTARWIAALPLRAFRWILAVLLHSARAAGTFVARLARGASRIPIRAFAWTISVLARVAQRAVGLLAALSSGAARMSVRAFTWIAGALAGAAQAAVASLAAIARGGARAAAAVPAHIARRAPRIPAPSRRLTLTVPSSVVSVPIAVVLTAIVTTHVVTRQGWGSETRQPENAARVERPALMKANLIEAGVGTNGPAPVTDRTPAPSTERRQGVPGVGTERRQGAPVRARRAVERNAPAVAAIRNTRSRDVRPAGAARTTGTRPRLVVTSIPTGARVTVDGIAWGVTPLRIGYLPPGDKRIRVTKDGYVGAERHLLLGEEGGTASVGLTLTRRR